MGSRFSRALVHLALVATILHSWLPPGWMPGAASDGAISFVICSPTGLHHIDGSDGRPDKGDRQHDACPFAAAVHLATPVAGAALDAPSAAILGTGGIAVARIAPRAAPYLPQSPRAPPVLL
jgi:hypothetical protein